MLLSVWLLQACASASDATSNEAPATAAPSVDTPPRGNDTTTDAPAVAPVVPTSPTPKCTAGAQVQSISELPGAVNATPITPGLALSQDENTIYFNQMGKSGMARAHRATRTAAFDAPEALVLGSNEYVYNPYLALDGMTLYVSRGGGDDGRIAKTDVSGKAASLALENVPSNTAVAAAFLDVPNGVFYARAYMLPQRELGIVDKGQFTAAVSLRIPTTGGATLPTSAPVLSNDGLLIYFAAEVTQPNGPTRNVLYFSKRATVNGIWQSPVPVAGFPDSSYVPGWLSRDNCRLYVTNIVANGWKAYVASMAL